MQGNNQGGGPLVADDALLTEMRALRDRMIGVTGGIESDPFGGLCDLCNRLGTQELLPVLNSVEGE